MKLSQSWKPATHVSWQPLGVHEGVACEPPRHPLPQDKQFWTEIVRLVSQPSEYPFTQSPYG